LFVACRFVLRNKGSLLVGIVGLHVKSGCVRVKSGWFRTRQAIV
jgi:hypothetical protein